MDWWRHSNKRPFLFPGKTRPYMSYKVLLSWQPSIILGNTFNSIKMQHNPYNQYRLVMDTQLWRNTKNFKKEQEKKKSCKYRKSTNLHEVLINCQKQPKNVRVVFINLKLLSYYFLPKMLQITKQKQKKTN